MHIRNHSNFTKIKSNVTMTFSEVTGLLFITEETMYNYTNKYTTFGAQKEKKKKKQGAKTVITIQRLQK